jgi:hypothetical protein
VPDGVEVDVGGFTLFGSNEDRGSRAHLGLVASDGPGLGLRPVREREGLEPLSLPAAAAQATATNYREVMEPDRRRPCPT